MKVEVGFTVFWAAFVATFWPEAFGRWLGVIVAAFRASAGG